VSSNLVSDLSAVQQEAKVCDPSTPITVVTLHSIAANMLWHDDLSPQALTGSGERQMNAFSKCSATPLAPAAVSLAYRFVCFLTYHANSSQSTLTMTRACSDKRVSVSQLSVNSHGRNIALNAPHLLALIASSSPASTSLSSGAAHGAFGLLDPRRRKLSLYRAPECVIAHIIKLQTEGRDSVLDRTAG